MCTRIFWNDNPIAQVVSRTIDWEFSDEPGMWVLPRGLDRTGGTTTNPAAWTSRHGSVSMSNWDAGSGEAVNEHGLAAHALYLGAAGYEPADDRPTVSNVMWTQWAVDNCRTVAETLDRLGEVRVEPVLVAGQRLPVHFALEDASGDSAIIEMLDGRPVVHHGREHTVMSNDPRYDQQLANAARYAAFGGDLPLPGDIVSADRFVRAKYFLEHLPEPENALEAVAGVLGLARNVAIPFGAPDNHFDTYPTWWLSVTDLTDRVYYFQSTRSPNVIWLALDDLDLTAGTPPRWLDPREVTLVGDVHERLQPRALPFGQG